MENENFKLNKIIKSMFILTLGLFFLYSFYSYLAFSNYSHVSSSIENGEIQPNMKDFFENKKHLNFNLLLTSLIFSSGLLFSSIGMKFRKKWAFILCSILGLFIFFSAIFKFISSDLNWGLAELFDLLLGFILFSVIISKEIRNSIFKNKKKISEKEMISKAYILKYKTDYSRESIKTGLKDLNLTEEEINSYLEKYS